MGQLDAACGRRTIPPASRTGRSSAAYHLPQLDHTGWQPGPLGRRRVCGGSRTYHLYVSLACPWAHRTVIFRKLKRLEDAISVSVVSPLFGKSGWNFGTGAGATRRYGQRQIKLAEIYLSPIRAIPAA